MVFKENMIFKYILLGLSILFSACTQTPLKDNNLKYDFFETIELNVEELIFDLKESNASDFIENESEEIVMVRKLVKSRLTAWSEKKFSVKGKKNKSILSYLKTKVTLKENDEDLGMKKFFLPEKKTYQIHTGLDMKFISSENISSKLNIIGSIDLEIEDNLTLNKKNFKIQNTIEILVKGIDDEINKQIKRNEFKLYLF
tara:strand:+ start:1616 stop:2215 length:600 start_codon:yes stop_codon:yes gene_type:complete